MIWKSLRPKYCPFASFCIVSFWWIFQKQKKIYTDQTQLKPPCSTGKWSTCECTDLLWQIRKCWVTHCSQMSDFSKSSLLLWFINTPQIKRQVSTDGALSHLTMNFSTRGMDLHGNGKGQHMVREPWQTWESWSSPQGTSSALRHHLPETSQGDQWSKEKQLGHDTKNQTCNNLC